jgi:hypothetical protein
MFWQNSVKISYPANLVKKLTFVFLHLGEILAFFRKHLNKESTFAHFRKN